MLHKGMMKVQLALKKASIREKIKKVEARVVEELQGIGKQNFRNEIVDTLKQLEVEEKYAPNGKDNFLLFSFASEMVDLGRVNLGDYVQTLAVQNALDKTFGSCNYDFYDRNALIYYDSKHSPLRNNAVVVMQGWFANLNQKWLPNDSLKPVYVGTHWTNGTIQYLRHLLIYRPHYFNGLEIGCRDLWTLENCYKLGIKAYFSRCLTLTFPKRVETPKQNKVFLVGIPKEWLQYIPQDLIKDAEVIEQQSVRLDGVYMHQRYYEATSELLERYRNEARLVITRALHCAAPCTAMGIPAVLIAKDPKENMTRFTAVDGILPIYMLQDLQEGKVDFNPCILDIEDLKQLMLENLKMSIQKARGEKVDEEKLCEIRKGIMEYRVCKNKMVNNVEGGGGADSCLVVPNKNTWKENFEYSLEFVERYKILLDLLPRAKKYKKIQSVLDIGCGK